MITSDDLLKAIEEVNNTSDEDLLADFANLEEGAIETVLSAASHPFTEDEATYMVTGIIVALRAVKNAQNSD